MTKKGKYIYDWPRPMVSVDAAVFAFLKGRARLLLIKRGKDPFKGKWALPGGFVGIDEELEHAVARMGIVKKGQDSIKAGDDAAKARWFDIEKLPKDLAFDHNEVVKFAIEKLKTII